jgi:hypothetical protein
MPLSRLTQLAFDREQVAIAVSDGRFGAHIGIAYHAADERLSLLHLFGHLVVRADFVSDVTQCWAACVVELPLVLGKQFVAIVRAIANKPPKIPYGLNLVAASGSFDSSGAYSPPPGSDGLTCASFVSEIFSATGLNLVDLTTWPSNLENLEWGNSVIKSLEEQGASKEHLATLGLTNQGLRLHPFEVAAAANSPYTNWPLDFTKARAGMAGIEIGHRRICPQSLGKRIRQILKSGGF